MQVEGELSVDLVAIYMRGTDAFGKPFDVALDQETARRLIFRLHRMVREQEQMRLDVSNASGGKVA